MTSLLACSPSLSHTLDGTACSLLGVVSDMLVLKPLRASDAARSADSTPAALEVEISSEGRSSATVFWSTSSVAWTIAVVLEDVFVFLNKFLNLGFEGRYLCLCLA